MKIKSLVLGVIVGISCNLWGQKPLSHPNMEWEMKTDYSDEFNSGNLNVAKWNNDVKDWGTWSWEPENSYVSDTVLTLRMQQDPHVRDGKQFYFTSGIARIDKTITYGYFEASIKGSAKWPGTCPAFWLYSVGQPVPTEEGGVQYSEIDAVELFQIVGELQTIEMNLHARILKDGELTWIRPGTGHGDITQNSWEASYDPRLDYHTYGVLNRVDSIFWYVDGVQRGAKENLYWHLPMHVTVSMGLRSPYEKYIDGIRTVIPPENDPEPGFPTEMYCDYVRVWEALPQIIVDKAKYEEHQFKVNEPIVFEYYFDAGSGFTVLDEQYNGVKISLMEIDADGTVYNVIEVVDEFPVGRQAGKSSLDIPTEGLTVSDELPENHFYTIVAEFKTSKDDGNSVVIMDDLGEVKIGNKDVGIFEKRALEAVELLPNPVNDRLIIGNIDNIPEFEVYIYDIHGSEIYHQSFIGNVRKEISVKGFSPGIYLLSLNIGADSKGFKFIKK